MDPNPNSITGGSSPIDDSGADTYDLLNIAARIEAAFRIRIPEGEIYGFMTADDLIQYAKMRIQANAEFITAPVLERRLCSSGRFKSCWKGRKNACRACSA